MATPVLARTEPVRASASPLAWRYAICWFLGHRPDPLPVRENSRVFGRFSLVRCQRCECEYNVERVDAE
jgi:hypothetical protein